MISHKENGRVLGAQACGKKGVDKRIDIIATAIVGKLTIYDLQNLDLAYAPQFSSPKDPVIIAGYSASNAMEKDVNIITITELMEELKINKNIKLVDVRTENEIKTKGLLFPGAIHIDVNEIRSKLHLLSKEDDIVLYCHGGQRSYYAARILMQHGFKHVRSLVGGSVFADPVINAKHVKI